MEVKDLGTAELHLRERVRTVNGVSQTAYKTPLQRLLNSGSISEEQYYAGHRLGDIFYSANIRTYRSFQLEEVRNGYVGNGNSEKWERIYRDAIAFVPPSHKLIIINVCCFYEWTREIGKLREGLNDLHRFFEKNSDIIFLAT